MAIQSKSVSGAEHDWYATRSSLPTEAPLSEHKAAYYISKGFGGDGKPLGQMEAEWLANVGTSTLQDTPYDSWVAACQAQSVTVGRSIDECKFNFFTSVASGTNP